MRKVALIVGTALVLSLSVGHAVNIVVTTTNSSGAGSLDAAITALADGDTISFNIDSTTFGPGPYYIQPPNGGYPIITKHRVTIDGYTQPSSSANTATFLSANNAKIMIVLDAWNSGTLDTQYRDMDYNSSTNQFVGYTPGGEVTILGIYGATNVTIKGLGFLGHVGSSAHYAISLAQDSEKPCKNVHIAGCWFGVDPADGITTSRGGQATTFDDCIAAFSHRTEFSYRFRGTNGATTCGFDITVPSRTDIVRQSDWFIVSNWLATNTVIASCSPTNFTVTTNASAQRYVHTNHIIGVAPGSANARAEQNVMLGSVINIAAEGQAWRLSGNRIGVYPDGNHDYIVPFAEPGRIMEGAVEIGRGASDCIIGTDGDGVNDAEERNVFGGVGTDGSGGSHNIAGYTHVIEFYSASGSAGKDRKDNRLAGNYVGIGVDGTTRFTNGVSFFNASTTGASDYWIGSDFDGVSDDIEANVIYNNYSGNPPYGFPSGPGLFFDTIYTNSPLGGGGSQGFLDQVGNSAIVSFRGNITVNNFPFPVNPRQTNFYPTYLTKALASVTATNAVMSPSSTTARIRGTAPIGKLPYKWTILDFYLADLEGLTNGVQQGAIGVTDPSLPNGWVQGKKYLGSYTIATTNVNTSPNLSTTPGQFELNTCNLGVTNGQTITVTANYSQSPPGTHNAITLTTLFSPPLTVQSGIVITSIVKTGTTVTISWCGGNPPYTLQSRSPITGAWGTVASGLTGPSTTDTISGTETYYQVIGNP